VDVSLHKEDWTTLFKTLEQGKIDSIIAEEFPILEAANELLKSGHVVGNIGALEPELL
jgi:NADPH:quinone reductase-like Zn-dependent oxidoreductase